MQTNQMKNTAHKRSNTIVLLVIATLLVLVMIFLPERKPNEPQYELTIRELGATSMLAGSTSEELGYGEVLLVYGEDMVVEDVNGQELGPGELSVDDRVRVQLVPGEEGAQGKASEPVISHILLLPGGSDDFI